MRSPCGLAARHLAGAIGLYLVSLLLAGCGQSVSQQPISTSSLPERSAAPIPSQPVYQQSGYDTGYRWNGNPERYASIPASSANPPIVWHASPRAPEHQQAAYLGSGRPFLASRQQAAKLPANVIEVQEGDTLYSLSRRHHVSVAALIDANRLPSINLQPGQRLMLPTRTR
jgi:hypothetical protein